MYVPYKRMSRMRRDRITAFSSQDPLAADDYVVRDIESLDSDMEDEDKFVPAQQDSSESDLSDFDSDMEIEDVGLPEGGRFQ